MSIDPQASANAVRALHDGERDGVATKIAIVRVVFPTSQTDLWGGSWRSSH